MNKVLRVQIVKPVDMDWKDFGNILWTLQRETRDVRNKAIQLCWEYQGFSADYKKENGEYPKSKDVLGYSNMMGYCYDRLKGEYNKMNTSNKAVSLKDAADKWKNDMVSILKGEISIPSYKRDVPLDVAGRCIEISKGTSDYTAKIGMLSNPYKKELGLKKGQIEVVLNVRDGNQKAVLDRIIAGEYGVSASKILQKNKKWFLNLGFNFEAQERQLNEDNIMGVDMGIVYPVYMAFNNSWNRKKIEGGEIERFRKQVEKRKNQMFDQGKYCGDGRIGHGTKTRIKPIEFAQNKVANFRDTVNHKYSRYIVDEAVKNNCGVIQMEDLSGISSDNAFLKNWTYFDLQSKIEYKAKEVGIKVVKVSPKFTSQRCSKCGCIDKENRLEQKVFECTTCGFKANADYNAAKNLSMKDIDKIIEHTLYDMENKKKEVHVELAKAAGAEEWVEF